MRRSIPHPAAPRVPAHQRQLRHHSYLYRGTLAALQDQDFFADYCTGSVWSLDRSSGAGTNWTAALGEAAGLPLELVGFGEGGAGDLHIVHANGDVFRVGLPNPACDDGLDNDADGAVDWPEDTGCANRQAAVENAAVGAAAWAPSSRPTTRDLQASLSSRARGSGRARRLLSGPLDLPVR